MNVFDITKKYYKLACMDGVKTWPLCQVNVLQDLMISSLKWTKWYQV
jgi:hypothetical protein